MGEPCRTSLPPWLRDEGGWTAAELDLDGVADIDEVADRLRDVEPDAEVSLLFVEADDAYLVMLRLDEGEDLRVFGSDSAFAEESRLGALLLGDIEAPALDLDDVDGPPSAIDSGRRGRATPAVDPDGRPGGRRRPPRRPRRLRPRAARRCAPTKA